ncbi:MarR family transcriptional regulator [Streptomyces sp. NPDC051320]|uniref:MarR family transcriptional regulator n=1 Tax=Streptomyces sp. NPDC051320 TaxID=3154644 RepID=UPI003422DCB2
MAVQNFSAALRAPASLPAHPMAAPGYGKRSAPGQAPRRPDDFLLLPERERYIAAFVDRLPDGAAMTIKTLAKQLPPYGQQAVSTALTALSVAGHLRRVRCIARTGDQVRWVFRTLWSRTARDNEWWMTFLAAEAGRAAAEDLDPAPPAPDSAPAPTEAPAPGPPVTAEPATLPAPPAPVVPQQPEPDPGRPSPAYLALAQLGCADHRLALSAADCEELESLAKQWLARGVTPAYLVHVLTAGLPAGPINSPLGFVRRRLTHKMPPHQPPARKPGAPTPRVMVECTTCGTPGRPEALPDGLCRPCRIASPGAQPTTTGTQPQTQTDTGPDVHDRVAALRALARTP